MRRLYTERMILRPWIVADAEALYTYASVPHIGPAAGWMPHTSVAESERVIRTLFSAPDTYAVTLRGDDRPIGCVNLLTGTNSNLPLEENEAEVGYWIGAPFQGRGLIPEAVEALMTHAFADLGLAMLWCGHFDGNLASERVQAKCGFRHRRTETNRYVAPIDAFRTVHISSISRQEWQQRLSARHH